MMLAASRRRDNPAHPARDPNTAPPYVMPTSAPWNAPRSIHAPTFDGTGEAIHPKVIDMHQRIGKRWRGWRYWMVMSPYSNSNALVENPSILVSNNGYNWTEPAAGRNPLFWPLSTWALSDPHLEYDPDNDELVVIFRDNGYDNIILIATSRDGVTWPARAQHLATDRTDQQLSPCLLRRGPRQWELFAIYKGGTPSLQRWRAESPFGPWSGPVAGTGLTPSAVDDPPWHLDVEWNGSYYTAVVDVGISGDPNKDGFFTATSRDGLTWTSSPTAVMLKQAGSWDDRQLYRACHTPHENGTHFRVWYSAQGSQPVGTKWGTGYVELPRSLWPDPPA